MDPDLHAVAAYMRRADTDDLLDRVTVYRDEMEPAAVDLMEGELARRGVTPGQIEGHARRQRATAIVAADGSVVRCSRCDRPAVVRVRRWYRIGDRSRALIVSDNPIALGAALFGRRLFGWLPLFPQTLGYCGEHRPPA